MVSQLGKIVQGQQLTVKANEPILLAEQTVWLVQSGSIAVFAVSVNDDLMVGTRRYLFSCEAGEALFGTEPSSGSSDRRLSAVPMEDTELLKVEPSLQALTETQVALLETWLAHLEEALLLTLPAIQVKAQGQEYFSLNDGQTLGLDQPMWVQVQQGEVRWLGEKLELRSAFPFGCQMWLEADGEVQLSIQSMASQDLDTLLTGLSQLHRQFLRSLDRQEEKERAQERQRLEEQERLNQQVTAEALGKLAAPLMPQDTPLLVGSPLLTAAGAVGRAMRTPIRPPARSEDLQHLKEPLQAIARSSRLRMRRVLLRDRWWRQQSGPLVGFREADNRPVALLPQSGGYERFDPVDNTRTPVQEHTAEELAPNAYMFYRSLPERLLTAVDVLQFALSGRGQDLVAIVFTGIAAALLAMLTPQATAILIDNAIPDSNRVLLLQIGVGLFVAAFAITLFRLSQGFSLLRVETLTDTATQAAVWDRLLNLPVSFFRQYTTGDLQSRVTSISQIRRQLSGPILIKLVSGLFALLNFVLLLYYSAKLALIAVVAATVTTAVTIVSGSLIVRKVRPLLEIKGELFGQTVQLIDGISKLRIAGAEERAFAFWSQSYARQIKLELSTQNVEDVIALFNTVLPTLTSGVLFWFTVQLLTEAKTTGEFALTIGTFVAFKTAFGNFIQGATDVSNTVAGVLQVVPQWKRSRPILETIPEVNLNRADPGQLLGRIGVDLVSFRYRADGPLVLHDITIRAEPGEFIALVGSSGSGKSTLLRLLLGFETPEDGTIYFDGQDLSGLDVAAVRRQLGVVLQSGRLMTGSVFDNLAGGAQITLDEAWEAIRMAGIADDIATMPMGLHTVLSEGGSNLSGGQRQRLLIARALVLKPRILLFDEATSALDNRTQAIVSESLEQLQVTRIVIAHRLSTIRQANRIYVLEAGRVVQQGSFDELASQPGLFTQLIQRQTV